MNSRSTIIVQAAQLAGGLILKATPSDGVVKKEGRANIVTSADMASNKAITELVKANFPDDLVLSEETESTLTDLMEIDNLWVIDPIDGTNNFRNQRNFSAVSIGYVEKGVIRAGAIFDPFRGELFTAEMGQGSYLNGNKIAVGTETDLGRATVCTDNSYDPAGTRHNLELLLKINPSPWALIKGSSVLSMSEVASGRVDLYFQTTVKPWDNAAAFLLVREAGGVVKDFDGNDANFLSSHIICGNGTLVNQCIGAFK